MEGGRGWEEKGGKGVSRSLAWQAVQAAVVGGTPVPSPLTHTLCRRVGGQPAPFPGPPACSLPAPAPCQLSVTEGQSHSGAKCQPVCRQEASLPPAPPAPFISMCPPYSWHTCHLAILAHLYLACFYPCTPLCTCLLPFVLPLDPQSPPLHTHL